MRGRVEDEDPPPVGDALAGERGAEKAAAAAMVRTTAVLVVPIRVATGYCGCSASSDGLLYCAKDCLPSSILVIEPWLMAVTEPWGGNFLESVKQRFEKIISL